MLSSAISIICVSVRCPASARDHPNSGYAGRTKGVAGRIWRSRWHDDFQSKTAVGARGSPRSHPFELILVQRSQRSASPGWPSVFATNGEQTTIPTRCLRRMVRAAASADGRQALCWLSDTQSAFGTTSGTHSSGAQSFPYLRERAKKRTSRAARQLAQVRSQGVRDSGMAREQGFDRGRMLTRPERRASAQQPASCLPPRRSSRTIAPFNTGEVHG
jgi:hypothetical protein